MNTDKNEPGGHLCASVSICGFLKTAEIAEDAEGTECRLPSACNPMCARVRLESLTYWSVYR